MAKRFSLSESDLEQLRRHGLSVEDAQRQFALFKRSGFFAPILRPCSVDDGIRKIDDSEVRRLEAAYDQRPGELRTLKFVPASGAASRMFKAPLAWKERAAEPGALERAAGGGDAEAAVVLDLMAALEHAPFFDDLAQAAASAGSDVRALLGEQRVRELLELLLTPKGLDYAALPKGLLKFHPYPQGGGRTACEEHMVEAAAYAVDRDGICRLHFTVATEHRRRFESHVSTVGPAYEEALGITYEVGFSSQHPSTDTVAVDPEGRPFRNEEGRLLLRAGGHGSLIENLGRLEADMVFIKNIDNVVPDHLRGPTELWKRVLGGLAIELRARSFALLDALDRGEAVADEALDLLRREFGENVPESVASGTPEAKAEFARKSLDRPMRVCGVVRNVGDPGGGPFWIDSPQGPRRQIVEISQIDPDDKDRRAMLAASTHFNPVDLVCVLRDRHGRPFDLERFIDEEAVFIVERSHHGRRLRSMERPGLWNGAMAGWLTVFVEVPAETFNPVKTVADLLGPRHCGA